MVASTIRSLVVCTMRVHVAICQGVEDGGEEKSQANNTSKTRGLFVSKLVSGYCDATVGMQICVQTSGFSDSLCRNTCHPSTSTLVRAIE